MISAIEACRIRTPRLRDDPGVQRDGAQGGGVVDETVEVLRQRDVGLGSGGVGRTPLERRHELQVLLVHPARLAEHQVRLQVLEQLLGLRRVLAQALLDAGRRAGQQGGVEFAHVGVARRVADRVPLVQAPAHGPRRVGPVLVGDGDRRPDGIEPRQQVLHGVCGAGARGLADLRHLALGFADVGAVAAVAERQQDEADDRHERHRPVGGQLQRRLPHLETAVHAGEARLGDQHVLQHPADEVRLAPARGRRHRVGRDAVAPGDDAEQPVDGRALLRAAGEVDAAQENLAVVPRRPEDVADELRERLPLRGHLLREGEDLGAPPDVPVLVDSREDPAVEPRHQLVEFRREGGRGLALERLVVGERDAPDLGAGLLREIVEVLREPGDEVALRHHHVHGKLDVQLLVQLVQPSSRGFDVRLASGLALHHQVGGADREDDAVDRAPLPGT